MKLPPIVSPQDCAAARQKLLVEEGANPQTVLTPADVAGKWHVRTVLDRRNCVQDDAACHGQVLPDLHLVWLLRVR
jgi:hypothetical protein